MSTRTQPKAQGPREMFEAKPAVVAQLINDQDSAEMLETMLQMIVKRALHITIYQRDCIDDIVASIAATAAGIDSAVSLSGTGRTEKYSKYANLRPTSGPSVLFEWLSYTLYNELWQYTYRSGSPNDDDDRALPKGFYDDASRYDTLLARTFALQPAYRSRLWMNVEDVLEKGFRSRDKPQPEVFVVIPALLLGAGVEIREYLARPENWGRRKECVWYGDPPLPLWDWDDVVEELQSTPCERDTACLPEYVKDTFELVKAHIRAGVEKGLLQNWDSQRMAEEAFGWYSRQT